jgi:streptogramin lyase
VRRVTPDGTITTFAGGGTVGVAGAAAGTPASDIAFESVAGLAVDADGNVYVSDADAGVIVRFDRTGALARVAAGELSSPKGLWVDQQGDLWFVDGQQIRRIPRDGGA